MLMIPSVAQLNDKQFPEIPSVSQVSKPWELGYIPIMIVFVVISFWGMFSVVSAPKKMISSKKKKKKEKFEVLYNPAVKGPIAKGILCPDLRPQSMAALSKAGLGINRALILN